VPAGADAAVTKESPDFEWRVTFSPCGMAKLLSDAPETGSSVCGTIRGAAIAVPRSVDFVRRSHSQGYITCT